MRGLTLADPALRTFSPYLPKYPAATHACWAADPDWSNPGDGNAVSSWRNKSGGGDPAQATGANQPIWRAAVSVLGGRSAVQFDGSNDVLDFDIANISQPFKLLAVFASTSGADGVAGRSLGIGDSLGFGGLLENAANKWGVQVGGTAVVAPTATVDTNPHVMRATVNGASSQLWLDGTSLATGTVGLDACARFTLGAGSTAAASFASFFKGYLAFAAIYASSVADADLLALERAFGSYHGFVVA